MATILVVEDEIDVQRVVAKRLSSRGFTVHCASDGVQAVSLAHKFNPDLIVLDLQLPAGDGLCVMRKLRMSGNLKRAHIVVLTGMTNEIFKQSVLDEGVDAYLQKPYDAQVLLDTIEKILVSSSSAQEPSAQAKAESGTCSQVKQNSPNSTKSKAEYGKQEPDLFDYAAGKNGLRFE